MITIATEDDIPEVIRLARNFFEASDYAIDCNFDTNSVLEWIRKAVHGDQRECIALLSKNNENVCTGLLGALKSKLHFSNASVALELCWWVDPEYRNSRTSIELFKAFEYWAVNVAKADKIQVSSLSRMSPEFVEKFYVRNGYVRKEVAWLKVIN